MSEQSNRTPTVTAVKRSAMALLESRARAIVDGNARPMMEVVEAGSTLAEEEWEIHSIAIQVVNTSIEKGISLPDPGFIDFNDPIDFSTYVLAARRVIGAVDLAAAAFALLDDAADRLAASPQRPLSSPRRRRASLARSSMI